jgi:hypothetical protein
MAGSHPFRFLAMSMTFPFRRSPSPNPESALMVKGDGFVTDRRRKVSQFIKIR